MIAGSYSPFTHYIHRSDDFEEDLQTVWHCEMALPTPPIFALPLGATAATEIARTRTDLLIILIADNGQEDRRVEKTPIERL